MWSVFFVLSHRCTDLRGDRPAAPHQQKSVGQSKIPPPLSLSVSHSFVRSHARALVHGHSHTLSSMFAARQQQVSEDRGHLCSGPPSPLLRLWSPLLGEDWPWRASRQPCLSALTSTPPRHKIPLMGTHLLWHRDLSLYIYRPPLSSPLMWTQIPLEKLFLLTTVSIEKLLWASTVFTFLHGSSLFIPAATWEK